VPPRKKLLAVKTLFADWLAGVIPPPAAFTPVVAEVGAPEEVLNHVSPPEPPAGILIYAYEPGIRVTLVDFA
jgi:hypothetical protein